MPEENKFKIQSLWRGREHLIHVFCYLKTCVEIHVGEKVRENVCNVV